MILRITVNYRTLSQSSFKWAHWSKSRKQQAEAWRALMSGLLPTVFGYSILTTSPEAARILLTACDTLALYLATRQRKSRSRPTKKRSRVTLTKEQRLKFSIPPAANLKTGNAKMVRPDG